MMEHERWQRMKDKDTSFKAITKQRLVEILNELPDDTLISGMSLASTGNFGVYKGVWPHEEYYGYIDLCDDTLTLIRKREDAEVP
jgi:hypothetical protein